MIDENYGSIEALRRATAHAYKERPALDCVPTETLLELLGARIKNFNQTHFDNRWPLRRYDEAMDLLREIGERVGAARQSALAGLPTPVPTAISMKTAVEPRV